MTVQTQPSQNRYRAVARRRGVRAAAVSLGLVLGSSAATAVAAPPEGWENGVNDSMLVSLLKLVGIPLLVIAVITLLTYLPSMMRGGRDASDPAGYFTDNSEWFGGPRSTPEAVESGTPSGGNQVMGGASARW